MLASFLRRWRLSSDEVKEAERDGERKRSERVAGVFKIAFMISEDEK